MLNHSASVNATLPLLSTSPIFPSSFSYPNPTVAVKIVFTAIGCLYLNSIPASGFIE